MAVAQSERDYGARWTHRRNTASAEYLASSQFPIANHERGASVTQHPESSPGFDTNVMLCGLQAGGHNPKMPSLGLFN